MISIILYGRNDSYGYNLHKRAAIGLNCMAELLDDPDDEILFVDYNTPDDFPTFPEAIADTLTSKARQRLRILRVRPSIHERFRARTHLNALEPIARNVALRRSNPANRWMLSTNTDMIFVSRQGGSLSAIARGLPDGYYHLPRFELPESLWEGFNRLDPITVMQQVERYGRSMFLNEVVRGFDYIKYDAPGDFQLIRRDDLFAIDGFDEEMLLGWHVDSNIAKRLYMMYRAVGDLSETLFGYHCDHIRQVTPAHEQKAPENDLQRFCLGLTSSEVPAQRESWGCPADQVEEIHLSTSVHWAYNDVLSDAALFEMAKPPAVFAVRPDELPPYDARHVLPFLVDAFASMPRTLKVAWFGGRGDTLSAFCSVWGRLGFANPILIDRWSLPFLFTSMPVQTRIAETGDDGDADIYVFDFGVPAASGTSDPARYHPDVLEALFEEFIRNRFLRCVEREANSDAASRPRRFICVDALNNQYQRMVQQHVRAASVPYSIRVRQGFVRADPEPADVPSWTWPLPEADVKTTHRIDLLPLLEAGDGGVRQGAGIAAPFGRRGYVCRGPFQRLPIGDYRVEFTLAPRSPMTIAAAMRPIILDVVAGAERLAEREQRFLLYGKVGVTFSISASAARRQVELRIFRGHYVDFIVTAATLTRVAPAVSDLEATSPRESAPARAVASSPVAAL